MIAMRTTVADVMTTDVTAVNHKASFRTVADLLISKAVSGVPVLDDDNHVLGVVTLNGIVSRHTEAIAAVRMAESIDGVVAVHDELTWKHDDVIEVPMWGGA
jgi:predicted transcriptional regulator